MTENERLHEELERILATVRRRWRLARVLRGATWWLFAGAGASLAAAAAMDAWQFAPAVVGGARIAFFAALGLALALLLGVPLLQKVSSARLALYVEEHRPELGMSFASAVELARAHPARHGAGLERGVLSQAVRACRAVDAGRLVERPRLRRAAAQLAGVALAVALVAAFVPGPWRHGLSLLLFPGADAAAANPYVLTVEPGDVLVSRGANQLVVARVEGFEPDAVRLATRFGAEAPWRDAEMIPGAEGRAFETLLFDLDESGEYYVTAGGLRSPVYRIEVAELPRVDRIDLTYRYPERTGLAPRRIENGGDIRAVAGTRVEVTVTPSVEVPGASLVRDGESPVALESGAGGVWTTILEVERDGRYRIDLPYGDGEMLAASPNYAIEVLPDRAPTIEVAYPGRDLRVTRVQEPLIEVAADDDLGVGRLELVYSINGGSEQTVVLNDPARPATQVRGDHVFYLEALNLHPGDLIAYYARAWDSSPTERQHDATDLFFLEVRPFDREFRQAQGGGGGGMMGGRNDGSLSAQQRQLVIATFKVVRDRPEQSEERFAETVATLAQAQARIRDRVQAIIRRLGSRSVMRLAEGYRRMKEELPEAVEAMRAAESALAERDPSAALPPAREALRHLQRADAAFREVQVARGRAGGGSGSAVTDAEDLANLFKLELDKLRSQYESVQRGRPQGAQAQLDETLQKLRELARRQQQEIERQRRRARLGSGGGGGSDSQRALADELEEMVRQLERLTREQRTPEMQAMMRELKSAAQAMRRAAAGGGDGVGEARAASERLREARRLLDKQRSAGVRQREVEEALARARRLEAEQERVAAEVGGLSEAGEGRDRRVQELQSRKLRMAEETRELERDLRRLAEGTGEEGGAAGRALRDAARSVREEQLAEKIERSAAAIDGAAREQAQGLEREIGEGLQELASKLAGAARAAGDAEESRLARNLEQLRGLVRDLESLEERTRRRAGEAGRERGERSGQGAPRAASPVGPWGWGGAGRLDGQDIGELRREWAERRSELEGLAGVFPRGEHGAQDISALIARMRELEQESSFRDPQALLERQAALIAALKEMELRLSEKVEDDDWRAPVASGDDSVPPEFRALVDDYFRDLSRAAGPTESLPSASSRGEEELQPL